MAIDPICGMKVKEKTGLNLNHDGHKVYFCSQRCVERFRKEHNIPSDTKACCAVKGPPLWKNRSLIIAVILIAICLVSAIFPVLVPFKVQVAHYFSKVWWAIILGLFLGGVIDYYIPSEYISKILSKSQKRTIFRSVMLGFFMSTCSHGILALSIQLHKKGASTPAVIAFLLASPWANMTFTIMLFGFFGWKAFYVVLCAILIAINTGLIFQFLERKKLIESNANTLPSMDQFSIADDIKKRFKGYSLTAIQLNKDIKGIYQGAVALADMVLWWLLIGIGLAGVLGAYVPAHIFHNYFGPTLIGLLCTLAAATVIEVCSEGSTPIAFEIYKQTGAFGNSFVFLMAGVATDYTEIGLLWSNVGHRVAIWLPVITIPQIIILGVIANILF